jgi:hypothetical protein
MQVRAVPVRSSICKHRYEAPECGRIRNALALHTGAVQAVSANHHALLTSKLVQHPSTRDVVVLLYVRITAQTPEAACLRPSVVHASIDIHSMRMACMPRR